MLEFITLLIYQAYLHSFEAVSPSGGDFSEPVTENTRRCVNVFLGLDRKLAYSRHYPAINWLSSYSNYIEKIRSYYEERLGRDIIAIRNELMNVLLEEDEVRSIMMLVGEDALSNSQKNTLDVSSLIRNGFLQQNAYNDIDKYVPLEKQVKMLDVIYNYYIESTDAIKAGVSHKDIYNSKLINDITQMKYNIKNDELDKFLDLNSEIDNHFISIKKG